LESHQSDEDTGDEEQRNHARNADQFVHLFRRDPYCTAPA